MNSKNCPQCGHLNQAEMKFCGNCGAKSTGADDLPPTVFSFNPNMSSGQVPSANQVQNVQTPAAAPTNQNFEQVTPQFQQALPQFQRQAPQQYQPQQFPLPSSQPHVSPPQKSKLKKFIIIGGIIGLLLFMIGGFALWRIVIEPYRYEQRRLKAETDNQNRANSTAAMSLLPTQFDYNGASGDFYRRKETFDKLQVLQASQNLPPALKQKAVEINDAAAATYLSDKNSGRKVILQIFKFNTPERAKATCQEIIDEAEKNRSRFKDISSLRNSKSPTYCFVVVEKTNNETIYVTSQYGFLYVALGDEKNPVTAASEKITDQLQPY